MGGRITGAALAIVCLTADASPVELQTAQLAIEMDLGRALDAGDSMQRQIVVEPAVELGATDSIRWHASARVRADAADRLEPGEPKLGTYSGQSRPLAPGTAGTAELRDFYVEADVGSAYLRAGKQQLVWGALDGLKILDAVNPQSFREFILDDFDYSRISLWTISA